MASVTGTSAAGAQVQAYLRDYIHENQLVATATANGSGNWSVNLLANNPDTDYIIVVYPEDGVVTRYSVIVPAGAGPFVVTNILGTARPDDPEPGGIGGAVDSVNGRTGVVTGLAEGSDLTAHTGNSSNPHNVTKTQVGLGSVDNTSDAAKPVSSAQQTALNLKADKANLPINAYDYGLRTTNTGAQNATALQAALTAAATGGAVYIPDGVYVCDPITLGTYQTLMGSEYYLKSGTTVKTQLHFSGLTGTQVGIGMGTHSRLRHLMVRGPIAANTCIGASGTDSNFELDHVQFYNWGGTGVDATRNEYLRAYYCEWRSCGVGLKVTSCHNVNLFGCVFGLGTKHIQVVSAVNGLSMFGGSLEACDVAVECSADSQVAFFGTYWETVNANAKCVTAGARSNITFLSNIFYIANTDSIVDVTGIASVNIFGRGNRYVNNSTSSTTPTAFKLPSSGIIDLSGGDWSQVTLSTNFTSASAAFQSTYFNSTDGDWRMGTGPVAAQTIRALGLGNATAAGRWAGTTTTGAPSSGTFNTGDFATSQDGVVYICTSGGSPGSWFNITTVSIAKTLVDAKGDLITATADNTPARLAVGTNLQRLVPNSAQSTGLQWVDSPNIQEFTSAGNFTWTNPSPSVSKLVWVRLVSAGSGGGSGRRGAAGGIRSGGGGGAPGTVLEFWFKSNTLGSTENVTVGAGGAGGAAQTANGTDGNNGTVGGDTFFGAARTTYRALAPNASGTASGRGGTAAAGGVGGVNAMSGSAGGTAAAAGTAGGNGGTVAITNGYSFLSPSGGGGGGGLTAADAQSAGGTGGSMFAGYVAGPAGGTAPGGVGANGTTTPAGIASGGSGGGGGASTATGAAGGNGGNGAFPGGGGGGGGASLDGNNSGAGGNGADGYAIVVTFI